MQLFMTAQTIPVSFPHAMPALVVPVAPRKPFKPRAKRTAKQIKPAEQVLKSQIVGIPSSPLND